MCVVDAILFTAGHAQLNLQRHADPAHTLEVGLADRDILFQRLFRKVQHMRAKQRFTCLLVVRFSQIEHAVDPGQELTCRVISMQYHRHPIGFRHGMDIMRPRCCPDHHRIFVGASLTGKETRTAAGKLNNHRRTDCSSRLKHGVYRIRVDYIDRRQCKSALFGSLQNFLYVIAANYSRTYQIQNATHFPYLLSCQMSVGRATSAPVSLD